MKTVLITGVSKGIGRETAKLLAGEGFKIVGTYNKSDTEAEQLKNEIPEIELHKVNFENRSETKEFLEKVKSTTFYSIINNAGIIEFEDWNDFTMETWDRTFEVNLNTPMLICHTLRNSIEDGGVIVNVSSTDGLKGSIASIAYSATKAALINLTLSLTNVFGKKKVRVLTVSPSWIGDGMGSPVINDARWITPLGRTAEYIEVANAISLLLSEKASYINGSNILLDGGQMAVDYCLKKEDEILNSTR